MLFQVPSRHSEVLKWHPKKAILSAIRNRHQVSTHQKMWGTFFLMCSRWMLCCNEITVYRVRNVMMVNAAFHCIFCVLVFLVSYVWPFLKDQIDFLVLSVRNILHMWLFFYASRSFTCYLNILPVRGWRFPVHIWERRDLDINSSPLGIMVTISQATVPSEFFIN